MIKKGIILEINKNNVIVITSQGEFLQLKKHRVIPVIGEEYEGTIYHKKSFIKPIVLAASILIFINVGLVYRTYFQVYNTIDVSINPSVKLYVNRKNDILKIQATNNDGKTLLSNMTSIEGENCEEGILHIIESAVKLKYLNSNNTRVEIHSEKENAINYDVINTVLKQLDSASPSHENIQDDSNGTIQKSDVILEEVKKPLVTKPSIPNSSVKESNSQESPNNSEKDKDNVHKNVHKNDNHKDSKDDHKDKDKDKDHDQENDADGDNDEKHHDKDDDYD